MSRLPSLNALHAFRHAGEMLSFKDAAERLHVTPTAISQQIKKVEETLGLSLFKRKTREVELTDEGKQLLPFLVEAFSLMERGVDSLLDERSPDTLSLSALPSFAARFLIPRMANFQQESKLRINLQPSIQITSFDAAELDLAVRFGEGRYDGLESKLLMHDFVLPVCHSSLRDVRIDGVAQLKNMNFLADDSRDLQALESAFFRELGIEEQTCCPRFQVSDANLLLEAVLAAQGYSLMRYSLVYDLLERGVLCCPLPIYFDSPFSHFLVAPESHFRWPKVRIFERWLRKELSGIEASWKQFKTLHLRGVSPVRIPEST